MDDADGDELANLTQFLYACPVGLIEFDGQGTIGLMNPKAMQLMQPLANAPFVSNFFTAFASCGPELRNLAQSFSNRRGTVCENRRIVVRGAVGEEVIDATVLDCTVVKLSDSRFIATVSDVSRQVAQERRLKQADVWFSSLIDGSDDFDVLSLDLSGRIEAVRGNFLDKVGLDRDEVVGLTLDAIEMPDPDGAPSEIAAKIALARRDGWHLDEGWLRVKGGGRRWCQRLIVVRIDEGRGGIDANDAPSGYVAVLRCTTRQSFDATKLRRLLQTDHLTGASNRARFFEVAEHELRYGEVRREPLAVLTLDIDNFKRVNDTYGHAAGDEVLKAIAAECQRVLGPTTVFARLGGEEFAALVSADMVSACGIAETLRAAIAALAIPTAAGELRVTASFGCAGLKAGVRSFAALLAEADLALYAAKRGGRNRVEMGQIASVA